MPTLGWDTRGERIYALRGFDPSKEKGTGVPGAEWLAFLGLTFFPAFARGGKLLTTGCEPDWKAGSFNWPLWPDIAFLSHVIEDGDRRNPADGQGWGA